MSKFSIKEAALAILSKSATIKEAAKGFSAQELNELVEVLEKAKFISPEQQKANKAKIKENDNKVAMKVAKITPKSSKTADTSGYKVEHVKSHPDMEEYSVHHNGKHLGYASIEGDGSMGGSIDWDHPHGDGAAKAIQDHHDARKKSSRGLKVIKADLDKAMNKKTGDGRYGKPNPDVEMSKDDPNTSIAGTGIGAGTTMNPAGVASLAGAFKTEGMSKDDPVNTSIAGTGIGAGTVMNPAGVSSLAGAFKTEVLKMDKNGQWKLEKEEKVRTKVKVQMDADTYEPQGKHDPVMAAPKNLKKSWTDGAQWELQKAIKPGPTLDYSQFNKKPDYAEIEAKAPTIDYGANRMNKPKWSGAIDRAKATRAKIDAEANESAAETLARRQKMNKQEGVNVEPELTAGQQKRMVAKNEMMGYGPSDPGGALIGNPGKPGVAQSEKEPHEDDPRHEEKEKKKAKKIKKEAESLLDMHKD